MYSASAPSLPPKTSSPGLNNVTFFSDGFDRSREVNAQSSRLWLAQAHSESASDHWCAFHESQSSGLIEAARTLTRIWLSAGVGFSISLSWRTSGRRIRNRQLL
jgi:hypothetical protein